MHFNKWTAGTPEQFTQHLKAEIARWTPVIQRSG